MEPIVESALQFLITFATYLMTMAFAGSFLGRAWMGNVDVLLHKILKIEVTAGKYVYWKYFCNVTNPPKPANLEKPKNLTDQLFCKFLDL